MNLGSQKRLAAEVMGVGIYRINIDPEKIADVSEALTRDDIRDLIRTGVITISQKKGISRGRHRKKVEQKRKGRHKGYARRSGTKNARNPKKRVWIRKIRSLRDELRKMKDEKKIDTPTYRKLYRRAKGNLFHSRRHLREYTEKIQNG